LTQKKLHPSLPRDSTGFVDSGNRRARKSSILWQAAASHPHQHRTKGEIRRDTDEEHGGNENCGNVTKVSQTFSIMKHSIRYRANESKAQAKAERALPAQLGY
jgi:hypothetical protein